MTAKQIRIAGTVILFTGLVAGVVIYFGAQPDEPLGILGLDIRTNSQRGQLERMGGKTYVMFKDLDDWMARRWRGPQLGCTIGVLAVAGFLLSRGVARVQEEYHRELASAVGAEGTPTHVEKPLRPNQSPEPTPGSVTPRAREPKSE